MKFCPNCGTKLEDDARFCTGCGTQQQVVEPAPVAVEPTPVAEPTPVVAEPAPVVEPAPVAVEPAPVAEPAPEAAPVAVAVAEPVAAPAPVAQEPKKKKKSKLPLIIVLIVVVLALAGAVVAGFMTDWFGLFPKEEPEKEELTYSDLAAAVKATFGAKSITINTTSTEASGELAVERGTVSMRFLFDRETPSNLVWLTEGENMKVLVADSMGYTYNQGEYGKRTAETDGLWCLADWESAFGEKDIDWEALMDIATVAPFYPNSFVESEFNAACDTCCEGMTLAIKGSTFTYTAKDKSVTVVFTVKEEQLTAVQFKFKNDDGETRLKVAFDKIGETTITEDEMESFIAEVEDNCAPTCEMCGEQEAMDTKGDYDLCSDCYYDYDFCSDCGKFAEMQNGKCEECANKVTLCDMCNEAEAVREYKGHDVCTDCFWACDECNECGTFDYLNDNNLCSACAGGTSVPSEPDEPDTEVEVGTCDLCRETHELSPYLGHNVCDTCFWESDECEECGEFKYVHYIEGTALCAPCCPSADMPQGVCEGCSDEIASCIENEYNLCYTCYWDCGWCDECDSYGYMNWDNEGGALCDECAGMSAA